MSSILSIGINGLTSAASRVAASASSIVNASSTTQKIDSTGSSSSKSAASINAPDLATAVVALKTASTVYDANAVVIKAAKKLDNDLLNIIA